jgi:hypothetical protein
MEPWPCFQALGLSCNGIFIGSSLLSIKIISLLICLCFFIQGSVIFDLFNNTSDNTHHVDLIMTNQNCLPSSAATLRLDTIHLSDMPEKIANEQSEPKEAPKEVINISSSDEILPPSPTRTLVHPTTSSSFPTETIDLTTSQEPSRSRLQTTTIMACLMAAVFVAALDVTIIVTALPTISRHFSSDTAYTWVGTAYVLTYNTSSPLWGSLSDIFGRKPILLSGIAVFFIGSLMCGAAPSLSVLLAGRAVQGLGGAGCIVLVNICVSDLFSLRERGFYFGLIGVMWALASGIGPVLGGVFTQSVS